ncbi:hypothetical protein IOCL2690_000861300 [Leishmania lindenbergi]|uniref:Uncharacterized protein n=1 Tax=Leishmania lindenbergi TaxID=651832 RepID=A0AAW2ZUA6_9TRYP
MQLAAATEYPLLLTMESMYYTMDRPSRHVPFAGSPSLSAWPSHHGAVTRSAQLPKVAAVHQRGAFICDFGDEKLGIAMNSLRTLLCVEDVGPRPAVV